MYRAQSGLAAAHKPTAAFRVVKSLPVCMADVWTVKKEALTRTGLVLQVHICIEHLCPAPPCSTRASGSALRNGGGTRAPSLSLPSLGCHGDRSVFWSMTGSTWKNRAAVVSVSLRRKPLFVLLSPGFPPRHVHTLSDSLNPVKPEQRCNLLIALVLAGLKLTETGNEAPLSYRHTGGRYRE